MQDNPRLGIALMIATTVVFAVQDGISRYLAENYNVITVVTIRYMFFMCFVLAYSSRQKGGIRQVASSGQLPLQIGRGLLLVAQICVAILSFSTVGLVNFHAVFASYPLMVMALSAPILGEAVGWRRWLAVCVGFCGVLLILRPGTAMFSSASILPVLAAFMMAVYGILTPMPHAATPPRPAFSGRRWLAALPCCVSAPFSGCRRLAAIGVGWVYYA